VLPILLMLILMLYEGLLIKTGSHITGGCAAGGCFHSSRGEWSGCTNLQVPQDGAHYGSAYHCPSRWLQERRISTADVTPCLEPETPPCEDAERLL